MTRTSFHHNGIMYDVKRTTDGRIVYRDAAHLGGPWSDATRTVSNTSFHLKFRRALRAAMEDVAECGI